MKITKLAMAAIGSALITGGVQAALFLGPAQFTTPAWTQAPGAVTNNLVLNQLPNGFSVTGQYLVNIPAGSYAGVLLSWEVERPLDPAHTPAQFMTNTSALSGFVQETSGGNVGAAGYMLTKYTATGGSLATVNITHAGPFTPFNVSSSATFFYTPGGTNVLRQYFLVDYIYNGPGGVYTVDFPADSLTDPIPEPASLALLALGALLTARRRQRMGQ